MYTTSVFISEAEDMKEKREKDTLSYPFISDVGVQPILPLILSYLAAGTCSGSFNQVKMQRSGLIVVL